MKKSPVCPRSQRVPGNAYPAFDTHRVNAYAKKLAVLPLSPEGDGVAYRFGGRGQLPPGAGYRLVAHRLDIWIEVGPPPVRLAPLLNPYHYHGNTEKPGYASRAKVAPGVVVSNLSSRGGATPPGTARVPRVPHTAKIASAEAGGGILITPSENKCKDRRVHA